MFFEPHNIDSGTIKQGKLRKLSSDFFSGPGLMDQVTEPGRRFANRFSNSAGKDTDERLKGLKKKEFWKIAPNGTTILRIYDGEEPIEVND